MTPDELAVFHADADRILQMLRERLGEARIAGAEVECTPQGRPIVGVGGVHYFLNRDSSDVAAARTVDGTVEFGTVTEEAGVEWVMAVPLPAPVDGPHDDAVGFSDARWN